jgi:hypothetical protein
MPLPLLVSVSVSLRYTGRILIPALLKLLESAQLHGLGEKRNDIGVKQLPDGVGEMVSLRRFLLVSLHNTELGLVL